MYNARVQVNRAAFRRNVASFQAADAELPTQWSLPGERLQARDRCEVHIPGGQRQVVLPRHGSDPKNGGLHKLSNQCQLCFPSLCSERAIVEFAKGPPTAGKSQGLLSGAW